MIIMADEVYFSFPVLLAAPPGSDKPYQPVICAEYDHLTSERAYPSALQEAALEAVRVSPEVPNTTLDSAKVIIYEVQLVIATLPELSCSTRLSDSYMNPFHPPGVPWWI